MSDYKNYINWLAGKLLKIAKDNGMGEYNFHVFNEQDFIKANQVMAKKDIFVIVKHLSASVMFNAKVEPIQIMILAEQNSLEIATFVFKTFVNNNNWTVTEDGTDYVKHQYSEPIVLNNFQPVGNGYRSVLYVSGTLYTLENIVDIDYIKINSEKIEFIDFAIAYTLATNTQPVSDNFFATSVRQSQTIGFTLTIPCKKSIFIENCLGILSGQNNGGTFFNLSIYFKNSDVTIKYPVKISSVTFVTAPSNIPSLKVGLIL